MRRDRPDLGILAITHYQRLLDHLKPDVIHILIDGRIVDSGGPELAERPELGVLAITHYQRLLDHLQPDAVHVLSAGRIIASGGMELATRLEAEGYEGIVAA